MIDNIVVKLNYITKFGSGVFYQPNTTDYTYIISARHCFIEEDNSIDTIDLDLLKISRQIEGEMKELLFKGIDIIDNIETDLIIIKIEYIEDIPTCKTRLAYNDEEINIIGFPNGLAGTKSTFKRFSLPGKVNDYPKKNILQINSQRRLGTNEQDAYDVMASFSGSGIFYNKNGQLFQVGIITEMSSCDGVFDSIIGVQMSIVQQCLQMNNWIGTDFYENDNEIDTIKIDIRKRKLVLFNNYSLNSEPYYIERKIDKQFMLSMELNNLWVHGRSGSGKTAYINRNLLFNNLEFCYCDFSPIVIHNIDDVINEIISELESQYNIRRDDNELNKIKQFNGIVSKLSLLNMVIVIDEISIESEELLCEIADGFMRIIAYCHNINCNCCIKFIISTIKNPCVIVKNKSKVLEYFEQIDCDSWRGYLTKLFDCIVDNLEIKIEDYKEKIIDSADNSPRLIKAMIRKILVQNRISESTVAEAILRTMKEVV